MRGAGCRGGVGYLVLRGGPVPTPYAAPLSFPILFPGGHWFPAYLVVPCLLSYVVDGASLLLPPSLPPATWSISAQDCLPA